MHIEKEVATLSYYTRSTKGGLAFSKIQYEITIGSYDNITLRILPELNSLTGSRASTW